MGAHQARHGVAGGGRSVGDILAQVAAGPGGIGAIAPPRSAVTVAATAAVGLGAAAAAAVTGTFPAIHAPTLPGFGDDSVSTILEPAASSAPAMLATPAATPTATTPAAQTSALPARSTGARGGTVMASDLHHSGASEIASLSKGVNFSRSAAPSRQSATSIPTSSHSQSFSSAGSSAASGSPTSVIGSIGSVVSSALTLPSRIGGVPIAGSAASASAANALRNAATRLGKPYVWGAEGPNAFDCSGLMQWAYRQAGIKLPRTSSAQASTGKAVPISDLKPGDMVFFYSPVSHVGMYIGNGKILHASEPGKPVKISNLHDFPIHNARRVTS